MRSPKLFVLLVLGIWFLNWTSNAWVVLHFYWNRAELVELYCENKANLTMHCDGKCYLAKQIAKTRVELDLLEIRFKKVIQIIKLNKEPWDIQVNWKQVKEMLSPCEAKILLHADDRLIPSEVTFEIFRPPMFERN